MDEYDQHLNSARYLLQTVDSIFEELLEESLSHVHVQKRSRLKTKSSLVRKIEEKKKKKSYSILDVTDIVGFRFVCHFQNETVQVVESLLEKIFQEGSTKDFEGLAEAKIYITSAPNQQLLLQRVSAIFKKRNVILDVSDKPSRYTSIHMVVSRRTNQLFEVQIRNVFEDAWAEIEHALKYKTGKDELPPSLDRHLKVLNTYTQACAEYSEAVLLDSQSTTSDQKQVTIEEIKDQKQELRGMPDLAQQVFLKAQKLRENGSFQDAVESISLFIDSSSNSSLFLESAPTRYYLRMERALANMQQGRIQSAINEYQDILTENPDRALVYFRLANAYRIIGDFNEAIDYLSLIEDKLLLPENTAQEVAHLQVTPFALAHAYWRTNRPRDSIRILQEAVEKRIYTINPDSLNYINCYIYYLIEIAQINHSTPSQPEMTDTYEKMKQLGVRDGNHWAELDTFMLICNLLGKFDEAKSCADQLESMLKYEAQKLKIVFKGKPSTEFPLEEVEMVRRRISETRAVA